MRTVIFSSGQAFDYQGRPTSCWFGSIGYEWNQVKKVFSVKTEQALGTGYNFNYKVYEEEVESCEELDKIIHNMKQLEAHYKKVYKS